MTRPTIIAGNWKHNPPRSTGEQLYRRVHEEIRRRGLPAALTVVVFPPFPYLGLLAPDGNVRVGAQDVSAESWGAFTGEVGAALLREFGATHVLVGHSERRRRFGDGDERVKRKLERAWEAGLVPVLCVGETKDERESGRTLSVLEHQMEVIPPSLRASQELLLAYEPVWAIGTGVHATPAQAMESHRFLRERLAARISPERAGATPILYGGSVNPDNIAALLECREIDGVLAGGASLDAGSFLALVEAARERKATVQ